MSRYAALIGFDEDPMQSLIDGRADLCVIIHTAVSIGIRDCHLGAPPQLQAERESNGCSTVIRRARRCVTLYPQINSPTNAVPVPLEPVIITVNHGAEVLGDKPELKSLLARMDRLQDPGQSLQPLVGRSNRSAQNNRSETAALIFAWP